MIKLPMRILYIIGSLEAGGTERQLLLLVKHLITKGFKCSIATLESAGKLTPIFRSLGVKVFEFGLQKKGLYRAPWKIFPFLFFLIKIIRTTRPDILHAYLPLVTMIGAIAGKVCRIPNIVISKRGLNTHHERIPVLKYCDIIADLLADRILVNSLAVKEATLQYSPVKASKIELIYNGIELPNLVYDKSATRRELGIPDEFKVITYLANLIEYKGHKDLLMAAAEVIKFRPHVRFLLVGEDRGIGAVLHQAAARLGIQNYVSFLGQRDDVWKILAASDIYVHPSREEGFSNAILEAMASQLPVIATRVGGNPEAVIEGYNGLLIAPRCIEALVKALLTLLNMPDTGRSMGEKGCELVLSRFTAETMADNYVKFYKKILRGN